MLSQSSGFAALLAIAPVLAHPAINNNNNEPMTTQNVINWSPMAHCTNWNPFQCRVTAVHTQTIVQEITSTVYVLVEGTATETVIMPVHTNMPMMDCKNPQMMCNMMMKDPHMCHSVMKEHCMHNSMMKDHCMDNSMMMEPCMSSTMMKEPHMTRTMKKDPMYTMEGRYGVPMQPPVSTMDDVMPTMTMSPPVMDPLCPSPPNGIHRQSSKQMASIWMHDQMTLHMPSSTHSMLTPAMPKSTPSVPATPGEPEDDMMHHNMDDMMHMPNKDMGMGKDMNKDMNKDKDFTKPTCIKKALHTYTLTFDDLHIPHIPKPYYGLEFSSHFSAFEPALIYTTYTAPSPPYAAISYPSQNSTIMSGSPFNLVSMYVGCEFAQTCLIRIRGWAPNEIKPSAEIQVKVSQEHENWTFVEFGNFGFNGLTMLEFDVLDLVTGMRGTLGLTMDEMMITRDVYELRDCFE